MLVDTQPSNVLILSQLPEGKLNKVRDMNNVIYFGTL